MSLTERYVLRLDTPMEGSGRVHFLPCWPPPDDFPVVVDARGDAISRFSDSSWKLDTLAGRPCSINFGDGVTRGRRVDAPNARLFRLSVLWFMYGERRPISCATLAGYAASLKPIFIACSQLPQSMLASDLSRFPRVIEEHVAKLIAPGNRDKAIAALHELYQVRDQVGFTLLTPADIQRLAEIVPQHEKEQTPFIPPRIWLYQAARLREFLEDYLAHRAGVEALFTEAIDAYRTNFGSLQAARSWNQPSRSPFASKGVRGCISLGTFVQAARRHGVADLLARWCLAPGEAWQEANPQHSIKRLNQYFNQTGMVGTAYLQCFSGMRDLESRSLRTNCLEIEHDPLIGPIYTLRGSTTKTTQDDDARWVASPSVVLAIDAMASVAGLRTAVAAELPQVPLTDLDREHPYLLQRAYEPWSGGGYDSGRASPTDVRIEGYSILTWPRRCARLFDLEQMRVQPEDERIARLVTPSLDLARYGVGQVWSLSPHQYRRTAAVNMSASDVVSDPSQQYQFKHLVRAQTVYYGKGFAHLRFNQEFAAELIATRYELAATETKALAGPDWVSPYGEARKAEVLLRFHSVTSADELERNMRKGLTAVKQTLFGVCTRRDPCPYGGHDNIAHCPTCVEALLDQRKRPALATLGRTIAVRLVDVPIGTPLRAVLEAEAVAVQEAIDVVT